MYWFDQSIPIHLFKDTCLGHARDAPAGRRCVAMGLFFIYAGLLINKLSQVEEARAGCAQEVQYLLNQLQETRDTNEEGQQQARAMCEREMEALRAGCAQEVQELLNQVLLFYS